jgi:hypothetical protein
MIAGTRIRRTAEASMNTANAMPTASIFTADWLFSTKLPKTVTMTAAAVVITRAVLPMPIATLLAASLYFTHDSCTRDTRNTS